MNNVQPPGLSDSAGLHHGGSGKRSSGRDLQTGGRRLRGRQVADDPVPDGK